MCRTIFRVVLVQFVLHPDGANGCEVDGRIIRQSQEQWMLLYPNIVLVVIPIFFLRNRQFMLRVKGKVGHLL